MNCYVGLAKRIVKSCFPQVVPVPQLEPLDARNIIKYEVKNINTNKECFALSDAEERVFKPKHKPLTDEEAWALTVAWAEEKAQERETKASSQTDTDESYDSDDSEVGVSIQHVRSKPSLFGDDFGDDSDEDEDEDEDDEYEDDDDDTDYIEEFARTKWEQIAAMIAIWGTKERAATIIQAAARGRAVRVWKAKFTDGLAVELTHIHRMRYLKRDSADWSWWFEALMLENAASPKCAIAWIKLAEQRRYSHHF